MRVAPAAPSSSTVDFEGSERFIIERRLGAGQMGVVYQAFDKERGERVALKTLSRLDPAGLYRLKQEFRTLADVSHPNLASLHELISAGDLWLITMELVKGVDFYTHVRGDRSSASAPALSQGTGPECSVDIARLRAALAQLVRGVAALHDSGNLHRDLKPSNVLVTDEGRVTILDSGLAQDRHAESIITIDQDTLAGNPAYMAPEQAAGGELTPAADWYAVGVMLYAALTGQLPFEGTALQVLTAKQLRDAAPPSALVQGVPGDLDAIAVALLKRKLDERAAGRDMALAFAAAEGQTEPAAFRAAAARATRFLGREAELAQLRAALDQSRRGVPVAVHVHGASGMGKTALVQRFLADVRQRDEAIVLSGRCYERESVPFKAFVSVVDALGRYLRHLPRAEAYWLLPRGVHELTRVFPSLLNVSALADVPPRTFEIPNKQELRRLAFAALKDLLARLVKKRAVVLHVDDLQWGDRDSALLTKEILAPPGAAAVLFVGTHRSDEAQASEFLRELSDGQPAIEQRRVFVGGLAGAQAEELALALLSRDRTPDEAIRARAAAMARESDGSPLFVGELAQHAASGADDAASAAIAGMDVSLDHVIGARVARLSGDARRLLDVIAVAGGPVVQHVAAAAAGFDRAAAARAALIPLRAGDLVRTRGVRDSDLVETYHDRIRGCVIATLDPSANARSHLALARAEEASGSADPGTIAMHYRAAGETDRAGELAERAADRAASALAFDRAAALYRDALEWKPGDAAREAALKTKLGDALLDAGRGAEAAARYLEVARGAAPAEALELRRRAAEQLLVTGHVDEGDDVLRDVLRAVHLPYATSSKKALALLLFRRGRLRMRGLRFQERELAVIPKEKLARIDICFSASLGLSVVDAIHAASLQAHHLLLALAAGEPNRIALGLALEAGHVSTAGASGRERALDLIRTARSLAERLENPQAEGFARLMSGIVDWGVGRWKSGLASTQEAERILRERCTGVTWEIDTAQISSMICMASLGDLAALSRAHPAWINEAQARGDRYLEASLRTFWGAGVLLALAAGDPARARAEVDDTMARWSQKGFHVQHYHALMSRVLVDLYEGRGGPAYDRVTAAWPMLARSLLLRVQSLRVTALHLRASAALASGSAKALTTAERDAADLAGEEVAWALPLADTIRAACAHRAGRGHRLVTDLLESAARGFDAADMALHAAVVRRQLGAIIGGEQGRALTDSADAFMHHHRVRDPDRMTATLAPGF
jgi:tetratricopeptide (TPR) repeat protein